MNFPIYTQDSAPAESRPVLAAIQSQLGIVPNLAASMAGAPPLLQGFAALRMQFGKTSFTGAEREAISLAVHHNTQCAYGMAIHSAAASKAEMAPEDLAALRRGELPKSPRLAALAKFACEVASRRGRIDATHVDAFCAAGFTGEQALEALLGVTMTLMASTVHHATRVELDAPLQFFRWPDASPEANQAA